MALLDRYSTGEYSSGIYGGRAPSLCEGHDGYYGHGEFGCGLYGTYPYAPSPEPDPYENLSFDSLIVVTREAVEDEILVDG